MTRLACFELVENDDAVWELKLKKLVLAKVKRRLDFSVSDFFIRKIRKMKQVSDGYEHSTCNVLRAL